MIISIANQKGGVGKTTTAINLSSGLALSGYKTLLIDMDPQANASISFIDIYSLKYNIYNVIVDRIQAEDVIVKTDYKNLEILPSRLSLSNAERMLLGQIDEFYRLKDSLKSISDKYDYVIIDNPPTLGVLTINSLVAATHLLIPIQASYFALEGTDDLLLTVRQVKNRYNQNLEILGVVVTMFDNRTIIARDAYEQVKARFKEKVFRTIITKSVRLEESPAYRECVMIYAPRSSGAQQYSRLTKEVISYEKGAS